jgi:hypothetical protein
VRHNITFIFSMLLFASLGLRADSQIEYWDIDTVSQAGAGGVAPNGTWNSSNATWSTGSTGLGVPTTWTPGNVAVFAAGSDATGAYTVTVSGTQTLSGLTVEEGSVTQKGGTLDFGTTANVPINVAAGATFYEDNTATAYSTFAGTGGLVKSGAGTLILRGFNTFSKSGSGDQAYLTIIDGVVDFLGEATLGATPASGNAKALTLNGGTLREAGTTSGGIAPDRSIFIGPNGGTFDFPSIGEFDVGGSVTSQFGGPARSPKQGLADSRSCETLAPFPENMSSKPAALVS